jgi:hypothetical protein
MNDEMLAAALKNVLTPDIHSYALNLNQLYTRFLNAQTKQERMAFLRQIHLLAKDLSQIALMTNPDPPAIAGRG